MISVGEPAPTKDEIDQLSHVESRTQLRKVRAQLSEVLKDRDRAVTRADELQLMLDRERHDRRHTLTVMCDEKECRNRLSVMSSSPAPDGKHARALFTSAGMIGWDLGQVTTGALFATMGQAVPATVRGGDRCPECCAAHLLTNSQHQPNQ